MTTCDEFLEPSLTNQNDKVRLVLRTEVTYWDQVWLNFCCQCGLTSFSDCFIIMIKTSWGISQWLGSGLDSDSNPSLSWATSMNILQLGSEIPSLHWKSELILVHTEGSAQARLRLSSGFSELRPEPSQCEMPPCLFHSFGTACQTQKSYYNLSSVMDSVCPLTPRPFMDLQAPNLTLMPWPSYYKIIINLYAWQSGWEPHWQGASLLNTSTHMYFLF